MIIADTREPKEIIKRLRSRGIEVQCKQLPVGDYLLPDGIAIERKSEDFIQSVLNGRIWHQLSNLKEYEHPILIIDDSDKWKTLYFCDSKYAHKSYFGAITTIIYRFNIPVIIVSGTDEFVETVALLYNKAIAEAFSSKPTIVQRRAATLEERKENMLACIEGMSIKRARTLLDEFGTIRNIANASVDDIKTVKGFGKKLAENIWRIFNE
ncbi:MAG: hypothetical protein DRN17_05555 [Thermoplasmata archaeon]|nr:MAG: hypothetical protein DRN17_05555 [Thermoplasmata archaeon]